MRTGLFLIAACCAVASSPSPAQDRDDYPRRSIRIVVSVAPGATINARQQLSAMGLGPHDVVYMDAGECETTDKVMQSVAGRPWELWKSKAMGKPRGTEA
jgi:hypothetical protein